MRRFFLFLLTATLTAAVGAAQARDGEFFGTLTGAALGGLIGSQFGHGPGRTAATVTGVFLGGATGNAVGHAVDREAFRARGPYGRSASYAPPTVVYRQAYVPNYVAPPAPAIYENAYGGTSREYSRLVRIGNRIEESYGTACLQPDGAWRIVR